MYLLRCSKLTYCDRITSGINIRPTPFAIFQPSSPAQQQSGLIDSASQHSASIRLCGRSNYVHIEQLSLRRKCFSRTTKNTGIAQIHWRRDYYDLRSIEQHFLFSNNFCATIQVNQVKIECLVAAQSLEMQPEIVFDQSISPSYLRKLKRIIISLVILPIFYLRNGCFAFLRLSHSCCLIVMRISINYANTVFPHQVEDGSRANCGRRTCLIGLFRFRESPSEWKHAADPCSAENAFQIQAPLRVFVSTFILFVIDQLSNSPPIFQLTRKWMENFTRFMDGQLKCDNNVAGTFQLNVLDRDECAVYVSADDRCTTKHL